MQPPRAERARQHNAGPRGLLSGATGPLLSGAAGALLACAAAAPPSDLSADALRSALDATPRAPGALRVQLAFGAGSDLDLFVTDPLDESAYFANPRTATGGTLDADRRCGDAAPRVETVSFAAPPPGRYRIGVDHPRVCSGDARPAEFVLVVEWDGHREERRGAIRPPPLFEPIVLEAAYPGAATPEGISDGAGVGPPPRSGPRTPAR
jgi:hypothetical protein